MNELRTHTVLHFLHPVSFRVGLVSAKTKAASTDAQWFGIIFERLHYHKFSSFWYDLLSWGFLFCFEKGGRFWVLWTRILKTRRYQSDLETKVWYYWHETTLASQILWFWKYLIGFFRGSRRFLEIFIQTNLRFWDFKKISHFETDYSDHHLFV